MEVEQIKIDELIPNKKNPRRITKAEMNKLIRSIKEFGFVDPIIVNKNKERYNVIIGGHQRVEAAKRMKMMSVPVTYVDLIEEKEHVLNIALNEISGEWDDEKLYNMLKELQEKDVDLSLTGFDDDELFELLKKDQPKELIDDTVDVEGYIRRKNAKYKVEQGDVWILGEHRLMCGDATIDKDIYTLMKGEKTNLLLTDPPYGMNAVKKSGVLKEKYEDVKGDENTDIAKKFCSTIKFDAYDIIIWGSNYFNTSLPNASCWLIWDKNNGNSDQADAEIAWTNLKGVVRMFKQSSEKTDRVHPTQKHPDLIAWCMKKSNGILVQDPFGGSGTTLIVAEQLGRKCYMMEIDPFYVSVIIERWEKLTGKKAQKIIKT